MSKYNVLTFFACHATPSPMTATFKNKHFGKIDPNSKKKKKSVTLYRIFLISNKNFVQL